MAVCRVIGGSETCGTTRRRRPLTGLGSGGCDGEASLGERVDQATNTREDANRPVGAAVEIEERSACLPATKGETGRNAPDLLLRVLALVELVVGIVIVEGVLIELSRARLLSGRQAGELVADLVEVSRVGAGCVTLGSLRNVLG